MTLTSDTNPWPTVKRDILPPPCLSRTPTLWFELICILAVDVLASMKCINTIHYSRILWHKYWRTTVRATTEGKGGVFGASAKVDWDDLLNVSLV